MSITLDKYLATIRFVGYERKFSLNGEGKAILQKAFSYGSNVDIIVQGSGLLISINTNHIVEIEYELYVDEFNSMQCDHINSIRITGN